MMAKVTNVIVKDIYPMVTNALSNQSNVSKYRRYLQKYFNKRHDQIHDIAPFYRMPYGQVDIDELFKSIGLKESDVEKKLHNTYYWKMNFNPKAAKDPLTVTMMMVIRHFLKKKDDKSAELASIYLAFSGKFYPSVHYNSFPKVQPIEYRHIMEYVVNEMLTQKFDLKREGTVFGAVRSICRTWLAKYKDVFLGDMDDEDVADLIQQLHGRLKSFMSNIAHLYYEAYQKNLYISYDSDNYSQDNFRIADTDSLKAERCVENTMHVINGNNVDISIVKVSSDKNVGIGELQSIIETIQSDKDNNPIIKELIRIIIYEYFKESKDKDVATLDFVNKSIVPKPNSKNTNIIRQKQIIESWLNESSPNYRRRKNRPATASSYYKSVLKYYVLLINKCNR